MAVVLILLSFLTLVTIQYTESKKIHSALNFGIIITSILILVFTEILSALNSFGYIGLLSIWTILLLIISVIAFKRKAYSGLGEIGIWARIVFRTRKHLAWYLFIIFFLLLVQGVIYPPNNYDSMTYHMARITHWLSNQNIYPYETNIYRQIYQPPLAEFWIAHICILSGGDFFANFVQLFFLAGIIAVAYEITTEFAFTERARSLTIIFILTTPEILLQATSTQNDIVVAYFILAAGLYCIRSYKALTLRNLLILGMCAGLACLTKGTAYMYLLPLFAAWGVLTLIKYSRKNPIQYISKIALIPLVIILLNGGQFYRNYCVSGSPLGSDENYFNEKLNLAVATLNLAKNAALHLGVPPLYKSTNKSISELHQFLGEKMDDPAITWYGSPFELQKWNLHEDNASNFFQFILIVITLLWAFSIRKSEQSGKILMLLLFISLTEFILFCVLLKWQPWHTRLHVPLFCMFGFTTGYIADKLLSRRPKGAIAKVLIAGIFSLMIVSSLLVILINPSRPYIAFTKLTTARLSFTRDQKYFGLIREWEPEYFGLRSFIEKHNRETGLIIGADGWEYPLYRKIFSLNSEMKALPHLKVSNFSKNTHWNKMQDPERIKYIILEGKKDTLHFGNKVFHQIKQQPTFTILKRE